jgi:hypothetical protein
MVACCCAQLTFLMHFGLFRGFQFHSDLKVLLLSSYDMILGINWLESHCPMKVHWGHKWVQIPYHGTTVKLFGTLTCLPAGSVFQLCDSNLPPGANSADTWLMEIQTLVAEFSSLFQPPTQLRPSRAHDHAIPLIAGRHQFILGLTVLLQLSRMRLKNKSRRCCLLAWFRKVLAPSLPQFCYWRRRIILGAFAWTTASLMLSH